MTSDIQKKGGWDVPMAQEYALYFTGRVRNEKKSR